MSYKITDNIFTDDQFGIRSTRLSKLSKNVEVYIDESQLPSELYEWASNAFQMFMGLLADQSTFNTVLEGSDSEYKSLISELISKYKVLKHLLISNYGDGNPILMLYGTVGNIPDSNMDIVAKAYELVEAHNYQKSKKDPKALPDNLVYSLKVIADMASKKHKTSEDAKTNSIVTDNHLKSVYEDDTKNLNFVYEYLSALWGKNDSRLKLLGFHTERSNLRTSSSNHFNLTYNRNRKEFQWDAQSLATCYQLVYSDDGANWKIAYFGTQTLAQFSPDNKNRTKFRVRARNGKGFGNWSNIIELQTQ